MDKSTRGMWSWSSWKRSQQVARLTLGCLFLLLAPSKCHSHHSSERILSEQEHYQLMQPTSNSINKVVNDYQINKTPTKRSEQQQQQHLQHPYEQNWTPLRDYKTPIDSLARPSSDAMKTAESVERPTGFLVPASPVDRQQTLNESRRQSACEQVARLNDKRQPEEAQLVLARRPINRRHVADQKQASPFNGIVDQPPRRQTGQLPAAQNKNQEEEEEEEENVEEGEDGEEPDSGEERGTSGNRTVAGSGRKLSPGEPLHGNESVSLESSMAPPGVGHPSHFTSRAQHSAGDELPMLEEHPSGGDESSSSSSSSSSSEANESAPDEAAEQREQEAAEASEAEAANRSALDEQQQAQREIILAQAQSEAKAIREQQEALLKQQQLQQQMLLRRHQNDLEFTTQNQGSGARRAGGKQPVASAKAIPRVHLADELMMGAPQARQLRNNDQQAPTSERKTRKQQQQRHHRMTPVASSASNAAARRPPPPQLDIQFSDQLEGAHQMGLNLANNNHLGQQQQQHHHHQQQQDEMGVDYSVRRPTVSSVTPDQQQQQLVIEPSIMEVFAAKNLIGGSDLLPAAQHHYGAHYGSLGGHHQGGGHYYQFAESHKKGQFDSGFKRGGKKFHISGHSSQHGSHAEGHVKWSSKKGKGMQYWDYKHKGKKMGAGGHYEGGHHEGGHHHY